MAAANTEIVGATATAAATPGCQRKKSGSGDWKEKFQGFFQTPMEEHKDCLKFTYQKMVGELKEKTAAWRSKDEAKPAPVETSPKN